MLGEEYGPGVAKQMEAGEKGTAIVGPLRLESQKLMEQEK